MNLTARRIKKAANAALAVAVAAVFVASVHSCVARRDDFARYPTVDGVPPIPSDMRVLLAQGPSCHVAVSGGYDIVAAGRMLFNDSRPLPSVGVQATPQGLVLGTQATGVRSVEVVPRSDATLYVNGSAYRGRLLLRADSDDSLLAINVLPLDDYLAGVISSEMPSYWQLDALKAQAIAARTYALYRARGRAAREYYLTAGTGDQVYKGIDGETTSGSRAVYQTRGLVLLYNWKILPAYYHSVCGGHTASRKAVFDQADITPLSGVQCPYCDPERHGLKSSKYYRWEATVPESQVLAGLAAKGRTVRRIAAVRPHNPGRSGHSRMLSIEPAEGDSFTISVDDFREIVGYGKLISNCFECSGANGTLVCRGRGFGHGVGMCQWGARGMAIDGSDFEEILRFYYSGAEIRRIY